MISTSLEWNYLGVLGFLIAKDTETIVATAIGPAIEDAFREGQDDGFHILLFAVHQISSLGMLEAEDYTGALFWAAWSGKMEYLVSLVTIFWKHRCQIFRALAGAISGKRRAIIAYLLRSVGVYLTDRDLPTLFTDTVQLILPGAFAAGGIKYPRSIASLDQSLLQTSKSGNLRGVIEASQAARIQHTGIPLRSFSVAFDAAAKNNHPDILFYFLRIILLAW